jgi:hypothetical protein
MRGWEEHDLANRPLRQILAALPELSKNAVRRRLGRETARARLKAVEQVG